MANPKRRADHVCRQCGKTFYPPRTPSLKRPYLYCSNTCRGIATRVNPAMTEVERNRQRANEWFYANRERAREKRKELYQRNRDKAIKDADTWRRTNPDKAKINKHNTYLRHKDKWKRDNAIRQARERGAEGTFTDEDIIAQYDAQNGICAYCDTPLNGVYDIDHVIPVSRGGTNWPDNLVCTCRFCNRSKADKLLSEWFHDS